MAATRPEISAPEQSSEPVGHPSRSTECPSTSCPISPPKDGRIRIPPVQVIQQISCEALHFLELFEAGCTHMNEEIDPPSSSSHELTFGERMLVRSPTWSRFLGLLFWPLKSSATYERLLQLRSKATNPSNLSNDETLKSTATDIMTNDVTNDSSQYGTSFNELGHYPFDVSNATPDQTALCLKLLAASLSTSASLLRLFLRLDGHWGTAVLAELDVPTYTLMTISKDSKLFRDAVVELKQSSVMFGLAPRSASKVKVSPMEC